MAFVLQFAPQDFVNIPKRGTIQYHPSLLPKYRGPSSINWPIIRGDDEDRSHHLSPDRRPRRRPGGAAERDADQCRRHARHGVLRPPVPDGRAGDARSGGPGHREQASRGRCRTSRRPPTRAGAARPRRSSTGRTTSTSSTTLIRGCNPAPGAWTTLGGAELQIFDARKHPVRTFGAVKGKIGEVVEVTDKSFQVTAQGGRIEVLRAKLGEARRSRPLNCLPRAAIKSGPSSEPEWGPE